MSALIGVLGASLLGGCIYKELPDTTVAMDRELPKDLGTVLVAPTQVLATQYPDPFMDGVFVGNVVHGGGYVQEAVGDYGQQTHSAEFSFSGQQAYAEISVSFVQGALQEALNQATLGTAPAQSAWPVKTPLRGSHPADGTDNVNLPRFTLMPPEIPAWSGGDHMLLSWVVSYYSHNAGWFYGQHMGSKAGAHGRVFWALYEPGGKPVAWADLDSRYLYTKIFQPNSAQTEDALIQVEAQLSEALEKSLR